MTNHTDWDPRSEGVLNDQRSAYDDMRDRCPVAKSEFLGWSLFRHADVVNVVNDAATFSSASRHLAVPNGMDPPRHTRYRIALDPFFDAERMAEAERYSQMLAREQVREIARGGDTEFISAFATPYPLKVLCACLGWAPEIWDHLRGWNHGNQLASLSRDRDAGRKLARSFTGLVQAELQQRRENPDAALQDMTAALMTTMVSGEVLSDDEIVSILRNWTAGEGTVAAGIGILVCHLAQHRALQEELRNRPERIPDAIMEILRLDGPLVANRRTANRDVTIGDRVIGADEKITLMWIAANRDAAAFDSPDDLYLGRDQSSNLLFGTGIHYCQGAPFAMLQMRIALEEMLSQTGGFEIAPSSQPQRSVYPSNGLRELRIRFS
jgi:cytochrome P450